MLCGPCSTLRVTYRVTLCWFAQAMSQPVPTFIKGHEVVGPVCVGLPAVGMVRCARDSSVRYSHPAGVQHLSAGPYRGAFPQAAGPQHLVNKQWMLSGRFCPPCSPALRAAGGPFRHQGRRPPTGTLLSSPGRGEVGATRHDPLLGGG